jgi:hypothetical protein
MPTSCGVLETIPTAEFSSSKPSALCEIKIPLGGGGACRGATKPCFFFYRYRLCFSLLASSFSSVVAWINCLGIVLSNKSAMVGDMLKIF